MTTENSMSNYWKWFNAKTDKAMKTDDGKAFADAGFTVTHTGGGFVAWESRHGESYVWITDDDGTGLFTTPETLHWTVGRYSRDGDCLECTDVKTVADAIETAKAYRGEMEKTVLTFEEFQQSRKVAMSSSDDDFEETYRHSLFGFKYADSCYIAVLDSGDEDGKFYLLIENQDWIDTDLSVLERKLYDNWYLSENEA